MTIAESERGQGVGRQLPGRVIPFARESSIRTLYLETDTKLESAVRLYESVSFRHMPPELAKPPPYLRARTPLFVCKSFTMEREATAWHISITKSTGPAAN